MEIIIDQDLIISKMFNTIVLSLKIRREFSIVPNKCSLGYFSRVFSSVFPYPDVLLPLLFSQDLLEKKG
jgi:hypothetical protein